VGVRIKRRLAAAVGWTMTFRPYPFAMDQAALKWRDLAERRQAYFVELYESGRWKHYYTDQEFIVRLREAAAAVNRWAAIAPRAGDKVQAAAK
jgi:uncharacterized repeat protein (TIGR03809 family)